MKRGIIIVLLLMLGHYGFAQNAQSKVVLKNGTTITGTIKEFNPTSHIVISVSGYEARVEMVDVLSVEEIRTNPTPKQVDNNDVIESTPIERDAIEDSYPESFMLKIGPYEVKMKLVRGDTFFMGYDGRGSWAMDSEPIHEVKLSSFYVNARPLSRDVVTYVKKGKEEHSKKESAYHPFGRRDAKEIVNQIAKLTDLPVDLITEAQWEYSAVYQSDIFFPYEPEANHCLDFYEPYKSSRLPQVDPVGPDTGKSYVIRKNGTGSNIQYQRFRTDGPDTASMSIRFTVPASSIKIESTR